MIPLVDMNAVVAALGSRLAARIDGVMAGGRFILGPEVAEFEATLAAWAGTPTAVGVASGTDALVLALKLRGVGSGDAVFVPAFTFVATAEAAVRVGAAPVPIDVDAADMTMDPADLKARVAAVRKAGELRPAAVIPVDLFGLPARYDEIVPLAEEEGLSVIADAAQSFGGRLNDRSVGALAPLTTLSFYPTKPLGCFGDGGAVLSLAEDDAEVLRALRQHGFSADRGEISQVGMNSRLDSLQAAVLLARMELLEDELARRAQVARWYAERLGGYVELPPEDAGRTSAWAVYTIRSQHRDRIRQKLAEQEIASTVFYPKPVCDYAAYADCRVLAGSLRNTRRLCERVLSLPMHPYLEEDDVDRIAAQTIAAFAAG